MGDLISIEQYYERRVNVLSQRYLKCRGTCFEKVLEDELREEGKRLANYQIFSARRQRDSLDTEAQM